eukprot:9739106-Alexandrium_andersonii.AAC.1
MSASLVGSEMCIRDREIHPPAVAPVRRSSAEALRPLRRAREGPPLPPVSYTHLTLPTICSV